jgi:hypothetical protein
MAKPHRRKLISSDRLPDYGVTISSDHRKELERQNLFPQRVQVTAKTHAYVESEILQYLDGKIAARDHGEVA